MIYTHRTIILPAVITPTCQALSVKLSGEAGNGMWTTGLSATGEAPATHYISSGMIGKEFTDVITDAEAMFAAAQEEDSSITLAQCEYILKQADVSEEGAFEALTRLELKMIQDTI
jgi:hypothetical protein